MTPLRYLTFDLLLLFLLASTTATDVHGQGVDLLRNGGCESFASAGEKELARPEMWKAVAGLWESAPTTEKGTKSSEGKRYFLSKSRSSATLEQVILLPPPKRSGNVSQYILVEGQCRSFDGADMPWIEVALLSQGGDVLQIERTALFNQKAWKALRLLLPLTERVRQVRLRLHGLHRSGNYCDVGFDALRARLVEFRKSPKSKLASRILDVSKNLWPVKEKLVPGKPSTLNWSPNQKKGRKKRPFLVVLRSVLTGTQEAPATLKLEGLDRRQQVVAVGQAVASKANKSVRIEISGKSQIRSLRLSLNGKGASAAAVWLRSVRLSKKPGREDRFVSIQEELMFSPLSTESRRELMRQAAATAEPHAIRYLTEELTGGATNSIKASAFEAIAVADEDLLKTVIPMIGDDSHDHLVDSWLFVRHTFRGRKVPNLQDIISNPDTSATTHAAALNQLIHPGTPDIARSIQKWSRLGKPNHTATLLRLGGERLALDDLIESVVEPQLTRTANLHNRYNALSLLARSRHPRFLEVIEQLAPLHELAWHRASILRDCVSYGTRPALVTAAGIAAAGGAADMRSLDIALSRVPSAVLIPFLFEDGLTHTKEVVRLASLAAYKKRSKKIKLSQEQLAILVKLANDPSHKVTIATISLIAGLPRSKDVDAKLKQLMGNRDPIVAAEALRASWTYFDGKGDVRDICLQVAARSFDWAPRVAAITLIGKYMPDDGLGILHDNLTNPRRQVRTATFEALTFVRSKETVDRLISRLKHEQGITRHVLRACLKNLTGFDWGSKDKRWLTWWDKQRPTFSLPPRPKGDVPVARAEGYASYYGISIQSRRVVFVIDTSGSMNTVERGKSRLERAQEQLTKVINTFDSKTRFLVIAFSDDPYTYADRLIRATRAERTEAGKRVKELYSEGGTNIFDSLEMAMDIPRVESIFLLSDGAPGVGRIINPDAILDEMKRMNRYARVRINTISIGGTPTMKNFMQRLAAQNYGSHASF